MQTIAQYCLEDLLERAGARLRGRGRADCPKCEGGSRGTLAYNDEVFHCHRCGWKGNLRTLARELNLTVPPETVEQREARSRAAEFEECRGICQHTLTNRYRELNQKVELAKRVLARDPDEPDAWEALARYYDIQAELSAALDILSFEKVSTWIAVPMTKEKLRAAFDEAYMEQSDAA